MEASDCAPIHLNVLCTLHSYHQSAKRGKEYPSPVFKLDSHTPCESKAVSHSPAVIVTEIPKDNLNPKMLN